MDDTIVLLIQAAVAYEEAWTRFGKVNLEPGDTWVQVQLDKAHAHQRLLDVVREYKREQGDQDDRE